MPRKRKTTVKQHRKTSIKQKTIRKHWTQSESNKEYGKYNSNTVGVKLIDVSFLDLFCVLKCMVLAVVDVPPPYSYNLQWNSKDLLSRVAPPPPFGAFAVFGLLCKVSMTAISGKHCFLQIVFLNVFKITTLMPDLGSAKKKEDNRQKRQNNIHKAENNQKTLSTIRKQKRMWEIQ